MSEGAIYPRVECPRVILGGYSTLQDHLPSPYGKLHSTLCSEQLAIILTSLYVVHAFCTDLSVWITAKIVFQALTSGFFSISV